MGHISLEVIQDCLSVLGNVRTSCHLSLLPLRDGGHFFKKLELDAGILSLPRSMLFSVLITDLHSEFSFWAARLHHRTQRPSSERSSKMTLRSVFNNTFLRAKGSRVNFLPGLYSDFNVVSSSMVWTFRLLND